MTDIKKRIANLEEKIGMRDESIPIIKVVFVGMDRKPEQVLILGPDGKQEWKDPE